MFGVECLLSSHRGFKGQLKMRPEDFVVKEISFEGVVASVADEETVDIGSQLGMETDSSISTPCVAQVDTSDVSTIDGEYGDDSCRTQSIGSESQKTCISTKQCQDTDVHVSLAAGPEIHRAELVSVLEPDSLKKLDEFADLVLEKLQGSKSLHDRHTEMRGPDLPQSSSACEEGTLNLGPLPSKASRTVVHKSVRQVYPHLRTTNHKVCGQDGPEVHVSLEPVIAEFQELGVQLPDVLDFVRFVESRMSEGNSPYRFENPGSKAQRTMLHRLIGRHFGSLVETKTLDSMTPGDQPVIAVRFRQKFENRNKKRKGGNRTDAPSEQNVFTGFTLQKTNTETLSAIQQLARLVGGHPSDFSYAGIKDKKAVTSQHMTIKGITTKKFEAAVSRGPPNWLRVGHIHQRGKPILQGQLWGNSFDVTLRNVELKEEETCGSEGGELGRQSTTLEAVVRRALHQVEKEGFINYFGEQRFGAPSLDPTKAVAKISAADIGLAMLQEKYEEAVNLILSPDDGPAADPTDSATVAKRCFHDTKSPKEALKLMPASRTRECLILKALNRHGSGEEGCVRALLNIPHGMRQMYVHAFCSLMWNRMASWRMRRYGCNVIEGDLVLSGSAEAHMVTREDISKGMYSVKDVILPLPGNRIRYPSNAAGGEYRRLLDEAGLGECGFRLSALKLNVPGVYRKLLARPRNPTWELGKDSGLHSGGERLSESQNKSIIGVEGQRIGCPAERESHDSPSGDVSIPGGPTTATLSPGQEKPSDCQNNFPRRHHHPRLPDETPGRSSRQTDRTLTLHFALPASCYATIFLRELTGTCFS